MGEHGESERRRVVRILVVVAFGFRFGGLSFVELVYPKLFRHHLASIVSHDWWVPFLVVLVAVVVVVRIHMGLVVAVVWRMLLVRVVPGFPIFQGWRSIVLKSYSEDRGERGEVIALWCLTP